MELPSFPPYFLQSSVWANVWREAVGPDHHTEYFELKTEQGVIFTHVYIYPWYFGKSFAYITKGPVFATPHSFSKESAKQAIITLLTQITTTLSTTYSIAFIKLDTDDYAFTELDITTNKELVAFLKTAQLPYSPAINVSHRKIQYLATSTLPVSDLAYKENDTEFFHINSQFWLQRSENIRRYTKKSLAYPWKIATTKTSENFENFWQIHNQTAQKQGFTPFSKEYFKAIFDNKHSRLIILNSEDSAPQAVWFGFVTDNTLTYLYGGNTEISRKHYGQYLLHLIALKIAVQEQCAWYDLGGLDDNTGYSNFKELYHGHIRQFLGPVDIVFDKMVYSLVNTIAAVKKILKKK